MFKNKSIIFVLTVMLIIIGCNEASSSVESESEPPKESSVASQIESSSSVESKPEVEPDPVSYTEKSPEITETVLEIYDYFDDFSSLTAIESNIIIPEGQAHQGFAYYDFEVNPFSDTSMGKFAVIRHAENLYSTGFSGDPYEAGIPRETFDEITMKSFGRTLTDYNNRITTVDAVTGNIKPTGWGGSGAVNIPKELWQLDSERYAISFYTIYVGMGDAYPEDVRENILKGNLSNLKGTDMDENIVDIEIDGITTYVFDVATDENGDSHPVFVGKHYSDKLIKPYIPYHIDSYTHPEFLSKANELGYTDAQLERITGTLSYDSILATENLYRGESTLYDTSPNGQYELRGYFWDAGGEAYFDVSYLYNTETEQKAILGHWKNNFSAVIEFINDEIFTATIPVIGGEEHNAGVHFYNVSDPKQAYASYDYGDATTASMGVYHDFEEEKIVVFTFDKSENFDFFNLIGTDTYKAIVLNYQGEVLTELDTNIQLVPSAGWVTDADFNSELTKGYDSPENEIVFSIGEDVYSLDIIDGETKKL